MSNNFIPRPSGQAMTDQDFISSAIHWQKQHDEHVNQRLAFSVVGLVVLFVFVYLLSKRSSIAKAGIDGLVSALAAWITTKRKMGSITKSIKERVYEKVDGSANDKQ